MQRLAETNRRVDQQVRPDLAKVLPRTIVAAGFEQQHAVVWIGGKAVGKHAAGAPRANDDVIDGNGFGHFTPPAFLWLGAV